MRRQILRFCGLQGIGREKERFGLFCEFSKFNRSVVATEVFFMVVAPASMKRPLVQLFRHNFETQSV
jgi:hypothetical protein